MPTPACTLILVHFKVSNFLINLLSFCATFKWRWTFFCFFFLDIFLICYSESVESFEYSDVLIRLLMNTLCILCRIELPYVRAVSLTDLAIIYFVNFKGKLYFIRFFITSFLRSSVLYIYFCLFWSYVRLTSFEITSIRLVLAVIFGLGLGIVCRRLQTRFFV